MKFITHGDFKLSCTSVICEIYTLMYTVFCIQIVICVFYFAGNGVDFDSGTYNVKFRKGSRIASFPINIIKDNVFEEEETFFLIIIVTVPSSSTYHIFRRNPYTAIVTIVDTACT